MATKSREMKRQRENGSYYNMGIEEKKKQKTLEDYDQGEESSDNERR